MPRLCRLVWCLVILATGCSNDAARLTEQPGPEVEQGETTAPSEAPGPASSDLPTSWQIENEQVLVEDDAYDIRMNYPKLVARTESAAFGAINDSLLSVAQKNMDRFSNNMREWDAGYPDLKSGLQIDYAVVLKTQDRLSILFSIYENYAGTAHPNSFSISRAFDLESGSILHLADLFKPGADYLTFISSRVRDKLSTDERIRDFSDADWLNSGTEPVDINYEVFTLHPDGIRFYFDPYQIAAYAAGGFDVFLDFEELNPVLRSD